MPVKRQVWAHRLRADFDKGGEALLNERTEHLLHSWTRLEAAASALTGVETEDAVLRLCCEPRFAEYREQLDYCSRVCSLLRRYDRISDEYALCPSDEMLELLDTMLHRLERPEMVLDIMTPLSGLLVADEDTNVLILMDRMKTRGLSHIPLLQQQRVTSVFSVETVFQAVLDGRISVGCETVMRDLCEYLPLEKHMNHEYCFVDERMDLHTAADIFEKGHTRIRKLKLLLVTADGNPESPLKGVVTPFDLMYCTVQK